MSQLIASIIWHFSFIYKDSTGPVDNLRVKILDSILFQCSEYPDSLILIYPAFDHFSMVV